MVFSFCQKKGYNPCVVPRKETSLKLHLWLVEIVFSISATLLAQKRRWSIVVGDENLRHSFLVSISQYVYTAFYRQRGKQNWPDKQENSQRKTPEKYCVL